MLSPSRSVRLALLAACVLLPGSAAHAQTLARPGWAGSGITTEPWWRSAVFYRIAPEHFQDSDGDGVGDLHGLAERLDYIQALGVDAIVLQLPFADAGFDDLFAEAARRHIRLVIGLESVTSPAGAPASTADRLEAEARQWLSRGAAGILLPPAPPPAPGASAPGDDSLRRSLRHIAAEYPGERVVIAPLLPGSGAAPLRLGTHALRLDSPQLALSTLPLPGTGGSITPSAIITALTEPAPSDGAPLLQLRPTATGAGPTPSAPGGNAAVAAAVLLTQRAAILLDYGQELGESAPARMPWTPSNVTPAPEPAEGPTPAPSPTVYGPYRPYIAPPPKPKALALSPTSEPALPDPNTLPGFSSRAASESAAPFPVPSVALQERDPRSLLNLYRRLLALHHGNATLRSGTLSILHESDGAAAWLRRAPAGARTVASVLVAANTGDLAVTLFLASDFARLRLHGGKLRSLLPGTGPETASSERLTLPPHTVFVGELYRDR